MKKDNRMIRINDEIKKTVAEIIRGELQDPRLSAVGVVSVNRVETTQDLKYCKIYISVLGSDDKLNDAYEAVKSAGGFIRKLVAERVNLRVTPQMSFIFDDSVAHGVRMSKLIDEVNKNNSLMLAEKQERKAMEEHQTEEQQQDEEF